MGRNKFEDQIKNKLAQREITPSAGSWEKLSVQLNSDEKKPAPIFWWIGIAATLLGSILIAGIVYNTNPATETPGLVETPVSIEKENMAEPVVEQKLASEENNMTDYSTRKEPALPKEEKASPEIEPIQENTLLAEVKGENSPVTNKSENESQYVIAENDEKISRKLEEIIAQVSLKDESEADDTYDEIDILLYKAASEISLERKKISPTGTVDAGDLLFAVEMELEESFREKVFDLLKEGYLKARTAVANRSYP